MDTDARTLLTKHLMIFYPEIYLPQFIVSVRDIYEERTLLKQLPCTTFVLRYLLDILIPVVRAKKRFKTFDCLNVIKQILKPERYKVRLEASVIADLSYLFKQYIFNPNEEVQMAVTTFLIGQELDDEIIEWLIEHHQKTPHIINRLLRYPTHHPRIATWAKEIYFKDLLPEREAEVLALLIKDIIPPYASKSSTQQLLWAIYYARISETQKRQLLLETASSDELDTVLSLAIRLEYPEVITHLLRQA